MNAGMFKAALKCHARLSKVKGLNRVHKPNTRMTQKAISYSTVNQLILNLRLRSSRKIRLPLFLEGRYAFSRRSGTCTTRKCAVADL